MAMFSPSASAKVTLIRMPYVCFEGNMPRLLGELRESVSEKR